MSNHSLSATLWKFRVVIACVVANIVWVWLSYREYGTYKFSVLHLVIGIIPLILAIGKLIKDRRKEQP